METKNPTYTENWKRRSYTEERKEKRSETAAKRSEGNSK